MAEITHNNITEVYHSLHARFHWLSLKDVFCKGMW